jgi:flagellar biosynthesis GTPase FlhF
MTDNLLESIKLIDVIPELGNLFVDITFIALAGGVQKNFNLNLNYYDSSTTIQNIYRYVSFVTNTQPHLFQLFVENYCLAFDTITWEGMTSPLQINQIDNEKEFVWDFTILTDNQIGIVDKYKTIFYERIYEIYKKNIYNSQIEIHVVYYKEFPTDFARIVQPNFYLSWIGNKIPIENPMPKITSQMIESSRDLNVNYVQDLYIEQFTWKISKAIENKYFDLFELKDSFLLNESVPYLQFIDYTGKMNIDLENSLVSIFTDFIDSKDSLLILQKWESSMKTKIKTFYHQKKTIIIRGFFENLSFIVIIHGDGEIKIEFEVPKETRYQDFILWFARLEIENNVFGNIFNQLRIWDTTDSLIFEPEKKIISFVNTYFILHNKKIYKNILKWLIRLNIFIRFAFEKKTFVPNVLLHLKYKRISNYQNNIFDAMSSFVYFEKINKDDSEELGKALYTFLKDGYDKNDEQIEELIYEWKTNYANKYIKNLKLHEGIDILFSKYGDGYKCYIVGVESIDYFIHCLFFVNNMLALYFSNKWKQIGESVPLSLQIQNKNDLSKVTRINKLVPDEFSNIGRVRGQSKTFENRFLTSPRKKITKNLTPPRAPTPRKGTGSPSTTTKDQPSRKLSEGKKLSIRILENDLLFSDNENNETMNGGARKPKVVEIAKKKKETKKSSTLNNNVNYLDADMDRLRGYRIAELKKYDPEVFSFQLKKKKGYARFCQTRSGRVPIVIPDENNFSEMSKKISRMEKIGETPKNKEDRHKEILRGDTRLFKIQPKKIIDGYALKYRDRFYICPEAWCIDCQMPLLLKDLNLRIKAPNSNEIIDFDTFVRDYYKKTKGHKVEMNIISGNCPICGKGIIKSESEKIEPNKKVLISSNVLGRQGYPGFISQSSHPQGLNMVCCFNNPLTRINPNVKKTIDGFDVYSEYQEDKEKKTKKNGKKKKKNNSENENENESEKESENESENESEKENQNKNKNKNGNENGNENKNANEIEIQNDNSQQLMKKKPNQKDKVLYIMDEKKFVHVDKYGLLPEVIDDIFNREILKTYKGISGIPFDKKNITYLQFLRKGYPWSKGMFSNLMDIVFSLIFFDKSTKSLSKSEKIELIINKFASIPNFENYFELSGDGYIANFFAGKDPENPIEEFFKYLRTSPIWHEEIILPILSIPGLIPLNEINTPLFVIFEIDQKTADQDDRENITIKLSSNKFLGNTAVFYIIKKRVIDKSSDTKQNMIEGGFNYEIIVFLNKEKNHIVREFRYFVTNEILDTTSRNKEIYQTIQNITTSFIDWVKKSFSDKFEQNRDMIEYFHNLEDITKLLKSNKDIKIGGQLIDISFRCTNILLIYRKYFIWLPIFPRKIIQTIQSTGREIRPFYFSNSEDRETIASFFQDILRTIKSLQVFENLFQTANLEFKYKPISLIQRILQSFTVQETIPQNVYITALKLNKYAFIRINRIEMSDPIIESLSFPIENHMIDNFTYDYNVIKNIKVLDEVHLGIKNIDKKEYDWNLIKYLFNKFMKKNFSPDLRKKMIEFIDYKDLKKIFLSFSRTLVWTDEPNSKSKIIHNKKTIYILNYTNVSLIKKLLTEVFENKYLRFSLLSQSFPWSVPKSKKQSDLLSFTFAEWKIKILDYITQKYLESN